jgi:hypothetical protein
MGFHSLFFGCKPGLIYQTWPIGNAQGKKNQTIVPTYSRLLIWAENGDYEYFESHGHNSEPCLRLINGLMK